ncbi:MAG: DUF4169 domain-containing protein [Alphaproteobacteria bacterium]|nr:MAG: DUF4169 domain-containing protein [Alphaproteobacteria bacterium]
MSGIINLNRARKARDKSATRAAAASNRVLHGLTRAEKEAARVDRERATRLVDGHRLDDRTPDPVSPDTDGST